MALNMRQEVEARAEAACRIADVQAARGRLDPVGYLAFTSAFLNSKGLELSTADPAMLEKALQRLWISARRPPSGVRRQPGCSRDFMRRRRLPAGILLLAWPPWSPPASAGARKRSTTTT